MSSLSVFNRDESRCIIQLKFDFAVGEELADAVAFGWGEVVERCLSIEIISIFQYQSFEVGEFKNSFW